MALVSNLQSEVFVESDFRFLTPVSNNLSAQIGGSNVFIIC